MELTQLSIEGARSGIQERKTTALAITEAHYAHIQKEDGQIGAFLTLCKERARPQARKSSVTISPHSIARLWRGWKLQEQYCWAKQTVMNSPWDLRMRTRHFILYAIPAIWAGSQAAPPAVQP